MGADGRTERSGPDGAGRERLLAPVIPPASTPTVPVPQPLPELPALRLPTPDRPDAMALAVARVDGSGRVHDRALLDVLGWHPGHRLDIATVDEAILVRSVPGGWHTVGLRGEVHLPAAARRMCGITIGEAVAMVAVAGKDVLVIHPATTVTRLLCAYHAQLADGHAR